MQPSQRKTSRKQTKSEHVGRIWIWIAGISIAVLALALLVYVMQGQPRFSLVSGDPQVLVLLRNQKDGNYRLRYEGSRPVDLNSLQVKLEGQLLHVDVKPAVLLYNGQEYPLEPDGSLPPGTRLTLQPNDEFDVRVTYLGQTLGGNYLYGFRIGYAQGERASTTDLDLESKVEVIVK